MDTWKGGMKVGCRATPNIRVHTQITERVQGMTEIQKVWTFTVLFLLPTASIHADNLFRDLQHHLQTKEQFIVLATLSVEYQAFQLRILRLVS